MKPSRRSHIPKYLKKRKLELLKRKIITRKFAYIFYRKTVSSILPSQAQKFYKINLLKKVFFLWCSQWYDNTIGWKLRLRAEIHYNLNLQQTTWSLWRTFHHKRKRYLVKKQMASLHFNKNKMQFRLKWCWQKWKLFINRKTLHKEKLVIAWNYFKSKHSVEVLKPFYYRWTAFIRVAQKERIRNLEAQHFYEAKLLKSGFERLKQYILKKKIKHEKIREVEQYYVRRKMAGCLSQWTKFVKFIRTEKLNLTLARTSYCCKIASRYFRLLLKNAIREKFLRVLQDALRTRCLRKMFSRWRVYTDLEHNKKVKLAKATTCFNSNLLVKGWCTLQNYVTYRRQKKRENALKLEEVTTKLKTVKLRFCFKQLHTYNVYKKKKQMRSMEASTFYKVTVWKRFLQYWRNFTEYKRFRKGLSDKALHAYKTSLMKTHLQKLRDFLQNQKKFREYVHKAIHLHQLNLLEEGMNTIALAGIFQKERFLQQSIAQAKRRIFLSQKYMDKWKSNTFSSRNLFAIDELCSENVSNEQRFPLCVLLPRILKL